VYAGNAICTVSTSDKIKILTIRGTNFEKLAPGEAKEVPVEAISLPTLEGKSKWVEN